MCQAPTYRDSWRHNSPLRGGASWHSQQRVAGQTSGSYFLIWCRSSICGLAFSWGKYFNCVTMTSLLHHHSTSGPSLCFSIEAITLVYRSYGLYRDGVNNIRVPHPHTMLPWALETASIVHSPHLPPMPGEVLINCQQVRRHKEHCRYHTLLSRTTTVAKTPKTMKTTQLTKIIAR